jgi:hypothetical protein
VSPHPTHVLVEPFTGCTVGIDVEMVPVISSLWRLGLETTQCCQGESAETTAQIREVAREDLGDRADVVFPDDNLHMVYPAVVCFAVTGRLNQWGLLRVSGRLRKGRQHAVRLAIMLHDVAPAERWRSWRWEADWEGSAVVFPNEDIPWLTIQLERIKRRTALRRERVAREAAGQLTLEEALAR